MTADGPAGPTLVGPWTMGRDKKTKPLDSAAFITLVKTASEFVRRQQQQQLHAALHQSIDVTTGDQRFSVSLDIEPDEENPTSMLRAMDSAGNFLAEARVAPSFKLNRASASAWAEAGFSPDAVRKS